MKTQQEIQDTIDILKLFLDQKVYGPRGYLTSEHAAMCSCQIDILNWVLNQDDKGVGQALDNTIKFLVGTNQIKLS